MFKTCTDIDHGDEILHRIFPSRETGTNKRAMFLIRFRRSISKGSWLDAVNDLRASAMVCDFANKYNAQKIKHKMFESKRVYYLWQHNCNSFLASEKHMPIRTPHVT